MDFNFLLDPIRRQVRALMGWALMEKTLDKNSENGVRCNMSMPADENLTEVPLVQHYGFLSRPKKGAKLLSLFMGGCHGNGYVIGSIGDLSKLPAISDGETCLYTDAGQTILLKKDGSIVLTPAGGKKVKLDSDVEVTGAMTVGGDVDASGNVTATGNVEADMEVKAYASSAFVTLSKHIHPSAMGPTSAPTPGI